MSTLFIADLHLSEHHPKIIQQFYSFLASKTTNVDALYILGDLFEVWIGDDEHTPLMDEVALKLTQYSTIYGIPIYYIHGNRDFMIGKKYAKQSSMQLLPEHHVIDLYGERVFILHGDTLCLADKNYQKMRKVIHNPALQFIFNLLPLHFRKKIGWKIRSASQSKKVYKDNHMMGVTQAEVERLLIKHYGDWFTNYSYIEATTQDIKLHIKPIEQSS